MRLAGTRPSRVPGGAADDDEVRVGGEGVEAAGPQGGVVGLGGPGGAWRGGSAAGGIFLRQGRGRVRWGPPKSLLPSLPPTTFPNSGGEG